MILFVSPHFDHDAFRHHALRVLDAPATVSKCKSTDGVRCLNITPLVMLLSTTNTKSECYNIASIKRCVVAVPQHYTIEAALFYHYISCGCSISPSHYLWL